MKILFVIKALGLAGGGAERVLAELSRALVERGNDVAIASFDRPDAPDFYGIDARVRRIRLGVGKVSGHSGPLDLARRARALRNAAQRYRPDVAVGFMVSAYVPLAIALLGTGTPVIASEHTDFRHWSRRRLQLAAIRACVALYAAMTILSERVRGGYPRAIARRMIAIANPVRPAGSLDADTAKRGAKTVLAVGRLSAEKDHRTLILAFAALANEHADWTLRVVGDGELRADLERQISDLRLEGRISLPGASNDVEREYLAAHIFAHPAIYESFGLVTAEALAHGLPAVGFADCPGTNELIEDGRNGILVGGPDRVKAFAGGLDRLMSSAELRRELGRNGPASIERFSIEHVTDRWQELLENHARRSQQPMCKGRPDD